MVNLMLSGCGLAQSSVERRESSTSGCDNGLVARDGGVGGLHEGARKRHVNNDFVINEMEAGTKTLGSVTSEIDDEMFSL